MAVTQNTYTGNGSSVLFSFTFPYLQASDIKVTLNNALTTAYTLANATTVQFNTAPANGVAIKIYRQTSTDNPSSTFYPGSAIRSTDLNNNFTQSLYVCQETTNYSVQDLGDYTFSGYVGGLTPVQNTHFATKQYVDAIAFSVTGITDGVKGDITLSGGGTVWTITDGTVTPAKLSQSYLTTTSANAVYQTISSAAATYQPLPTVTTTAVSKTLSNNEMCTVTASGVVLTLPASPSPANRVTVNITGNITNTVLARNGSKIMSLSEDMIINAGNASITLTYIDSNIGWRII